jgi:hypothetical protein
MFAMLGSSPGRFGPGPRQIPKYAPVAGTAGGTRPEAGRPEVVVVAEADFVVGELAVEGSEPVVDVVPAPRFDDELQAAAQQASAIASATLRSPCGCNGPAAPRPCMRVRVRAYGAGAGRGAGRNRGGFPRLDAMRVGDQ